MSTNIIKGYSTIGSVSKVTESGYANIGGVWKPITEAYTNIGGVWKSAWETGAITVGSLSVGSSVFMDVNGVSTEFIVVHQGLPYSTYDSSCDGTWLLMKDVYSICAFRATSSSTVGNSYTASDIDNTELPRILGLFTTEVQSIIKEVKIPYWSGKYSTGSLKTGSDGLSTKLFLLSSTEIGLTAYVPSIGERLDYFVDDGTLIQKRIAYKDGVASTWWLRTPSGSDDSKVRYITESGSSSNTSIKSEEGVRPALILPSETLVDDNNNIITE